MNFGLRLLPPIAALLLAACGGDHAQPQQNNLATPEAGSEATRPATRDLAGAIRAALEGDSEANYFDAPIDLDGDGNEEVVVYVAGPMLCGTGGCPLLVFAPAPAGYRLVSRMSVVKTPVYASTERTNGWRSLVVRIGGGGMASGYAELKFDGTAYPSNPTVPPAVPVPEPQGAQLLIRDFGSYTEGKQLPQ